MGEASLADLNARLAVPAPVDRFRPNVVASTVDPFMEDSWGEWRRAPVRGQGLRALRGAHGGPGHRRAPGPRTDPLVIRESLATSAQLYLDGHHARDPLASPLYGNLAGLPPVRIQVGEDEVLRDDSRRYGERLEGAGGTSQVHTREGMTHVFSSNLSLLRAGTEALDDIGDFLRQRLLGGVA